MDKDEEIQQLKLLLEEAVEMLDDNKVMFALFEKQHYYRFKAKLEAHSQLFAEQLNKKSHINTL
jgi:RNA binding exosome subunit